MDALVDSAEFYLRLQGFNKNQILERKMFDKHDERLAAMDLSSFAERVASEKTVPGGGSVSAYAGALAAGLLSMVSRLTLNKAEYEEHWPKAREILDESESVRQRLMDLVDEDSQSFTNLMQAYRLPKENEEQKRVRSAEIQSRLKAAADVPMATAEHGARVLALSKKLAESANENALLDLETAIFLANASTFGALANASINLASIKDEGYRKQTQGKIDGVQSQIEKDKTEALKILATRAK